MSIPGILGGSVGGFRWCLAAMSLAWVLMASAADSELQRRKAELSELEAGMANIVEELERTRNRRDVASERLREVELRISRATASVREIESRASLARQRVARLRVDATRLERELVAERSRLGPQLQAAYRFGPAAPLRILLDAESVRVSQRMVTYLGYLHRARVRRIAKVVELSLHMDRIEADAVAEEMRVNELLVARRDGLAEIQRERDHRQGAAEKLSAEMSDRQREFERLDQDRVRLEALVQSLQAALANREKSTSAEFGGRRGQLSWPVEGRLAARFGQPRGDAGLRWTGVLIAAPTGREIKAVHDGTVVFAEWLRGFGLTLIIDHGQSYLTVYSHNDALYRELGDRVVEGDVVAEVGRSGGEDRDALYFEIRHRGKALDPSRWLARR